MTAVLLGLLIGSAIGATGLGGGTLAAPLLILLLGFHPAQAVGTALLFSSASRLNGVLLYLRRRQVSYSALGLLLVGGVPGAVAGTAGTRWLRPDRANLGIAILGATVILAAGFSLFRSYISAARHEDRPRTLPCLGFPIGLSVGFSSAGAGALGTVALFSFTKLAPATVVGTDLLFGFVLSTIGGGLHFAAGNCDLPVLLKLIVGGLVGATAGSYVAGALPARALRTGVLAWAIVLGAILVIKGLEIEFVSK